jgi:hypothetical protein
MNWIVRVFFFKFKGDAINVVLEVILVEIVVMIDEVIKRMIMNIGMYVIES